MKEIFWKTIFLYNNMCSFNDDLTVLFLEHNTHIKLQMTSSHLIYVTVYFVDSIAHKTITWD